MALLLLRPLGSLRQRGARHSPSSVNGALRRRARRDSPQPEPTSLWSASDRPQEHRHEVHPPKKTHCLTRGRQLNVLGKHSRMKKQTLTRGRHRWLSRVPGGQAQRWIASMVEKLTGRNPGWKHPPKEVTRDRQHGGETPHPRWVRKSKRHRRCKRPHMGQEQRTHEDQRSPQHQRLEDPLISTAACKP